MQSLPFGENAMRSVLALGLLIAIFASTGAAAREHYSNSRNVFVRPSRAATTSFGMSPNYTAPSGVRVYRDDTIPGGVRTYHDDPPAYNDPSKWGGA
jgi:hypothetical protein